MELTPQPWAFQATLAAAIAASADEPPTSAWLTRAVHRAVAELRRVARRTPARANAGVLQLCAYLPPVYSITADPVGTLLGQVRRSLDVLVALCLATPVTPQEHAMWLAMLWSHLERDTSGCLHRLAERWGELCRTQACARTWADRLLSGAHAEIATATSLACLSSQVAAGQPDAVLALLATRSIAVWPERQFGVWALAARGEVDQALAYAAASNPLGHRYSQDIAVTCEAVLLAAGRRAQAYREFAPTARARQNCRQTFQAIHNNYPEIPPGQLLTDLLAADAEHEGRWFATACALRFYNLAQEIAERSPCDPRTLARIGTSHLDTRPEFALALGVAAVRWLCAGHGVELSGDDVFTIYDLARTAALRCGCERQVRHQVAALCDQPHPAAQWAQSLLARELES